MTSSKKDADIQNHLLSKDKKNIENWYDEFQDTHENRGEHRAVITREIEKDTHHERDRFGSQFQYLVSVLGFAAGFGSVWRFPYLIFKNGGGVFLIPYFILLFLIGIPSFYFETALGQMFQRGPPQTFEKVHKKWKGVGIFQVLVCLNMSTYYNLILAYSIYFLFQSFSYPLPWSLENIESHPEPWNKEYFYKEFLNSSSGLDELGGIVYPIFFCYLLSQFVVYLCISKGVSVSGKIAVITATSPYILLFLLMIRGFFLKGAWSGIVYLFSPDWSKLFHLQVWVDAANQIIFQSSTGCAVLVFFGSYRHQNQEVIKTSILVPLLTVTCGFLASIVIFSFMGYMQTISGIPIAQIPLAGPDLAFVVFPGVLTLMPFSNLLSIIFFLTMVFLGNKENNHFLNLLQINSTGIDTQFAFMDSLAGAIEDEFHGGKVVIWNRTLSMPTVRFLICGGVSLTAFLFCSQAGFYYLGFIDSYSVGINLITAVLIEVFVFTWIEKYDILEDQIKENIGVATPPILVWLIKYSIPVVTAFLGGTAVILQIMNINNQSWACSIFGWILTLYPYVSVWYYYKNHKDDAKVQDLILQKKLDQKELENMK